MLSRTLVVLIIYWENPIYPCSLVPGIFSLQTQMVMCIHRIADLIQQQSG